MLYTYFQIHGSKADLKKAAAVLISREMSFCLHGEVFMSLSFLQYNDGYATSYDELVSLVKPSKEWRIVGSYETDKYEIF